MELVPKTKYTPFRSESLSSTDDTNSNPSLPTSAPITPLTPTGMSSSLSATSLTAILPPSPRPAENSPTTFCSFFPRMGALRLGVSATLLPGLKAGSRPQLPPDPDEPPGEPPPETAPPLTAPSPSPRPPQDMNRLGGASRRARVEGSQLGGDEWTRHGSFVNKPTRGWLHADSVLSGAGVSYSVRARVRPRSDARALTGRPPRPHSRPHLPGTGSGPEPWKTPQRCSASSNSQQGSVHSPFPSVC
ncbi:hypothetical protein SKAU_G00140830 [Synaphobranchus kaupii]|uniref:Uncharacterized protein n=1 Tax=Synaphobranchus kaupii TaxID=118154 RepID=A0A9Q1J250_SYNKA|nr:hypothetical protein SKAU_G00140830 [Synaphobranchus kaupii]